MEIQTIPKDPVGETLNSEDFFRLYEAAPRLMKELIERAGLSFAAVRKMAAEGKLTSAVLLGVPSVREVG